RDAQARMLQISRHVVPAIEKIALELVFLKHTRDCGALRNPDPEWHFVAGIRFIVCDSSPYRGIGSLAQGLKDIANGFVGFSRYGRRVRGTNPVNARMNVIQDDGRRDNVLVLEGIPRVEETVVGASEDCSPFHCVGWNTAFRRESINCYAD